MKFIKICYPTDNTVLIYNLDQLEFLNFHDVGGGQNYAEIKFKKFEQVFSLDTAHEQTKMMMNHGDFKNPSDWFLLFLNNDDVYITFISVER